jgi:hypothetical protein
VEAAVLLLPPASALAASFIAPLVQGFEAAAAGFMDEQGSVLRGFCIQKFHFDLVGSYCVTRARGEDIPTFGLTRPHD